MAGIQNTIIFSQGERLQASSAQDVAEMKTDATDVSRINHTGSPEGVINANPSSLCHDPVSGVVYYKSAGTGNTGWIPIPDPIGQLSYFANAGGDAYITALGWLKANGQVVSQATYPTLFARVGLINPPGQYW